MKKIIFLILLFLAFNTIAFAQTNKELFNSGVLAFKDGLYQQAIDQFTQLIKIAPNHADAYKNRGVAYMKQEKIDLAIKDFEKAKELFPELQGLYSNLGVAWYYKKEYQKSVESYDLELELAPENAVAHFNRALSLAELGNRKRAIEDLDSALNINPDFYWAICYKADLLAQEGETQKAIEVYKQAITQDSQNTYAIEKVSKLEQELKKKKSIAASLAKSQTAPKTEPKPETVAKPAGKSTKNKTTTVTAKPKPSAATPLYTIQIGAFLNGTNAERMQKKLTDNGFDAKLIIKQGKNNKTWNIVRSGSYSSLQEAETAKKALEEKMKLKAVVRKTGRW